MISKEHVVKTAGLARLRLTEEEIPHFQEQLSRVLDFFDQMDQLVDHLGNDWRGDVLGTPTPERPDEAVTGIAIEDVMDSAPQKKGTAFQVPKIIE